jgi:hypothetical protein
MKILYSNKHGAMRLQEINLEEIQFLCMDKDGEKNNFIII